MGTPSRIYPYRRSLAILGLALATSPLLAQGTVTQATTVPLLLPGALAYNSTGNLYFAETANHVVRRIDTAGVLTIIAGTGTQGFSGDSGLASAALLDSPTGLAISATGTLFLADTHNQRIRRIDAATGIITTIAGTGIAGYAGDGALATAATLNLPGPIALDAAGNIFFADTGNHRIRRIDAATAIITTVAGNGTQGFSSDGTLATSASIDSPAGIALDATGDIYLADTHNQRIRRIDAVTGVITTVAGTGQLAFAGDGSAASTAAIALPHGITVDSAGNLYLSDFGNQRIRRIDALTGNITTIAGEGTQTFAGDGSPAITASFDTPRAVTLSPTNLVTLSDTGNARIRQIDAAGIIHPIGGLGNTAPGTLNLTGPSVTAYGGGSVTATLVTSPATGAITFFDTTALNTITLATVTLAGNAASSSTSSLRAGLHSLSATYPGDALHAPARSSALALTVSPAPAAATPVAATILYGQPIPALTGTLTGVLPQDAGNVAVAFSTTAVPLSPAAAYPIAATLSGTAAGNYALTVTPAPFTIAQAPSASTLTDPLTSVVSGTPVSLSVYVASTTSGTPTGSVTLFDGVSSVATASLVGGYATLSTSTLSLGTHTLTGGYAGDQNFLPSTSNPVVESITGAGTSDFTLTATTPTNVTIPSGSAASYTFAVATTGPALSSPITLAATGLPTGAIASFSPAYLPPGSTPTTFTLSIQTPTAALGRTMPFVCALILPLLLVRRTRRSSLLLLLAISLAGCGERVFKATSSSSTVGYTITINATTTSPSGTTIQHSTTVSLNVQP
jgi:sugar lactone lactonase YvrE